MLYKITQTREIWIHANEPGDAIDAARFHFRGEAPPTAVSTRTSVERPVRITKLEGEEMED
jgi:hypothetical protein